MWLPRDERHVLLAYYANIFDLRDRNVRRYLEKPKWFCSNDWTSVLKSPQSVPIVSSWLVQERGRLIKTYGDGTSRDSGDDILSAKGKNIIAKTALVMKRLEIANAHLQERKLVEISPHNSERGVAGILLTLEGYDLARRYGHWFGRTGLWFREYKDHWIWLIIGFVGGVLGALAVQWLSE